MQSTSIIVHIQALLFSLDYLMADLYFPYLFWKRFMFMMLVSPHRYIRMVFRFRKVIMHVSSLAHLRWVRFATSYFSCDLTFLHLYVYSIYNKKIEEEIEWGNEECKSYLVVMLIIPSVSNRDGNYLSWHHLKFIFNNVLNYLLNQFSKKYVFCIHFLYY